MKNLRKLSALVLSTVFATMQISMANPIDTGLGTQNGGAVINNTTGGFAGLDVGTLQCSKRSKRFNSIEYGKPGNDQCIWSNKCK